MSHSHNSHRNKCIFVNHYQSNCHLLWHIFIDMYIYICFVDRDPPVGVIDRLAVSRLFYSESHFPVKHVRLHLSERHLQVLSAVDVNLRMH